MGVGSSIQERLILSPYVTELVNLPLCDVQCLIPLCIVFLAGFDGGFETENGVRICQNGENLASSSFLKMVG